MYRLLTSLIFGICLAGCATPTVMLRSEATGQIARCGGGAIGSIALGYIGYTIEKSKDEICVKDYEANGFKLMQEQPQQSASNRIQTFNDGKAAYNKGDYEQAIRIWTALATLGNADAQNNLGVMYVMGIGVVKDDQEALKWFRLAAAQGTEFAKEALKRPEMVEAAK